MRKKTRFSTCIAVCLLAAVSSASAEDAVSFNRDIRPILAANCLVCHGPDAEAREADLRLDIREQAIADRDGRAAIRPGKPDESELLRRITSSDPDERMPPVDTGKKLSDEQVALLRRWIAGGAGYEQHWAFLPPQRPAIPAVKDAAWPRGDLDRFVLARLEQQGLRPSPEADRYTLVRRLYLDLIGLPPMPEEADAFAADTDPRAYERLVERLLESEHYGERWARVWLDLARYSDTNGYEKDRPRSIWPYRDWVVRALNADMPYDRFSIEQLAGDMLPGATLDQRIATGFHRNTMLNEEGGIDPLEYRFYAMVDRAATTGTVWLGLTTGCAQCHTHKYDPITQTDYYRLMALLDNADEPDLIVPDAAVAERRRQIEQQISRLEAELPNHFPPADGGEPIEPRRQKNLQEKFAAWIAAEQPQAAGWTTLRPHSLTSNSPKLELLPDGSIFSSGDITKRDVFSLKVWLEKTERPITALRLEALPDERLPAGGPGRTYYEGRKGDFFLSEFVATIDGRPIKFTGGSQSFGKISIGSGSAVAANVFDGDGSTGWSTAGREGEPHQLVLLLAEPFSASGELAIEMLFERHYAASLGRFRLAVSTATPPPVAEEMPEEIEALLARGEKAWSNEDRSRLLKHFLRIAPELAEARKPIDALREKLPDFPTTMVFQERPADNPRPTYRHHRGEYLSPREQVAPGLPAIFSSGTSPPSNRLEFARWLVSRENPLAARVAVNRAWQAFFGRGLVLTSEDFGTQADPPSHPQLLDWLAVEFMDGGWSLKNLHRTIVLSATYRQDSRAAAEAWRRDPENRWLARGPRLRVDGETVRDILLQASGLLSEKMFGPSVYPPQPESVTALAYGADRWPVSTGEDRFRRSLYTFSKRTAPFAAFTVFDAPTGENCTARRDRSNTPLQALTLLNDAMFLEMARALAAAAEKQAADRDRAAFIFRRLMTRPPTDSEIAAMLEFEKSQERRLQTGELKPAEIAGDANAAPGRAAWVLLARALMNANETITKP